MVATYCKFANTFLAKTLKQSVHQTAIILCYTVYLLILLKIFGRVDYTTRVFDCSVLELHISIFIPFNIKLLKYYFKIV